MDVFGIGADGWVWHKAWRGGPDWDPPGSDWTPIGGDFSQALAIAAISWGPDRIDLFGIAGDNKAWHKAWRGSQGWDPPDQGWAPIGGNFALAQVPSLLSRAVKSMDITAVAGGGAWSKGWYGGADWDPAGLNWPTWEVTSSQGRA